MKFDANSLIEERAVSRGSFLDVASAAQHPLATAPEAAENGGGKTNNVSKCADFFHAIDFDIYAEIQIALSRER